MSPYFLMSSVVSPENSTIVVTSVHARLACPHPVKNNEDKIMARYVSLLRFTDQGARDIKKTSERAASFKAAAAKRGITVEMQLWTTGQYDGLLVLTGDQQAILGALVELTTLGNVRTETLQAFTSDELYAPK
jgi:uncharacterized protein with GYD domain